MTSYRDFTIDPVYFGSLGHFVEVLHNMSKHYIPIIDAGISVRADKDAKYTSYLTGVEQDVFIKTESGEIFVGQVWPVDAAYPDFFNPNTTTWWND